MHRLLLATRNSHKTREFAEILGDRFEVRDLTGAAELPEIEETGNSFEENAILKAVETSRHFPDCWSWRTIRVSKWTPCRARRESILRVTPVSRRPTQRTLRNCWNELDSSGFGATLASARFRCSLALARGGQIVRTFEGVVEGVIVDAPRGSSGFGYDPIFQPNGFDRTFAELSAQRKEPDQSPGAWRSVPCGERSWIGRRLL